MSFVVRILRLQTCCKSYAGNNLRILNKNLISYPDYKIAAFASPAYLSSFGSYTRSYALQVSQTTDTAFTTERKRNNLEAEFQFIDSLVQRGTSLRKASVENLYDALIASDNVTPSQTLFLLRCCGNNVSHESKEARSALASKIWNGYLQKGLSLDISHYNALLQILVDCEAEFAPLDFLTTLKEKNIEPNSVTHTRLILKYCQKGDLDGANKILEFMKEKGMALNEYIFNALILGNSRANDLEGAKGILDIMQQSGLTPSTNTYEMLVQAYAENAMEEVEKVVEDLMNEDKLSKKSIGNIISLLAERNQVAIAEKILSTTKKDRGFPLLLMKPTASRLLLSGHDELAFKLYKSTNFHKELNHMWSFFPKLLASSELDLYKVVNYCDEIRKNGWNILSFELAVEDYLNNNKFDRALGLLRVMKEKNITLKEHYFYPIIMNAASVHNREQVLELIEEIIRMEIPISPEFFSTYALRALKATGNFTDIDAVYNRIMNSSGSFTSLSLYNGVIEFLIRERDLNAAVQFVKQYPRGIYWSLSPLLADIYLTNPNTEATAVLLRQMLPFSVRTANTDVDEENIERQYTGVRNFFRLVIENLKYNNKLENSFLPLLKVLASEGIYLLPSVLDFIKNQIGEAMTPEIEEALAVLSNIESTSQFNYTGSRTSLRQKIKEQEANGEVDAELNIILLCTLMRQRNITEVDEVLEKLKANNKPIPIPVQIKLMELYVDEKRYNEAESIYTDILDKNPEVTISAQKIMLIARMVTEQGRYDDAIKYLLISSPEDGEWTEEFKPNSDNLTYRNKIVNMLADVARNSDVATLQRMQEALHSRNYGPPVWIFPSLIHHFVRQGCLEEAVENFVKVAEEHDITPGKMELTIACIEKEDADKIQKIIDVSSRIHGEMSTLYDLVFALIDSGKLKQAEKVLQTSGMRSLQEKLDLRCEHYLRFNKIASLEGLIKVTRDVFNVDKQKLYNYLLKAHISADDPDKALGVWNTMQEESVDPDSIFLLTLGNFLISKGLEVPFVMPSPIAIKKPQSVEADSRSVEDRLTRALDKQDIDKVEELFRSNQVALANRSMIVSRVISLRLEKERVALAVEETKKMLQRNQHPTTGTWRKMLLCLEKLGDTETIEYFGKHMSSNVKGASNYNIRFYNSQIFAGRAEELINESIKIVSEANSSEVIRQIIEPGSYFCALQKNPELLPQLEKLAVLTKEKGSDKFWQNLFEYHFLKDNKDEAEKIYNEHLKDLNDFRIREICSNSHIQIDTKKLDDLLEVLNRKPEGRENIKGFAYSTYIDILGKEGKFEEALEVINKSLQSIKLENYLLPSLRSLKTLMASQHRQFPYEIPKREIKESSSSSSSSSSSDDEK